MAGLFQVLWGKADGSFRKAETLNGTDNEPLIIPVPEGDADPNASVENICTRPTAVDWDLDGDLDLVVGNFRGTFYWFTGEGKGRFAPKPQQLMADGSPLLVEGHHSDPFPIDWDRDGDVDLLSGSNNGDISLAENIAGPKASPVLKPFQVLIAGASVDTLHSATLSEKELKGPCRSVRIWVDDVNQDQKLDILVGDCVTIVSPAAELSQDEFKQQLAKWQEDYNQALKQFESSQQRGDTQKASQKINELYLERSKIMSEDRTGFVWLYLQK